MVSVILPVHNRQDTLVRAVRSVLDQTYGEWELLICDDGSTDNTAEVLRNLSRTDSRIRVMTHPKNLGAGAARNTLLREVNGEYIALLDSDDEWYPGKLERQIRAFREGDRETGVCITGAEVIKNRFRASRLRPRKDWEEGSLLKFLRGDIVYITSTTMFARSCLDRVGYMAPELKRGQDDDFLLRVLTEFRLVVVGDILAVMHLTTVGKDTYGHVLVKADYMMDRYYERFLQAYGKEMADSLKGWIMVELATAAFMEHHYCDGLRHFREFLLVKSRQGTQGHLRIMKSLLHGAVHWGR